MHDHKDESFSVFSRLPPELFSYSVYLKSNCDSPSLLFNQPSTHVSPICHASWTCHPRSSNSSLASWAAGVDKKSRRLGSENPRVDNSIFVFAKRSRTIWSNSLVRLQCQLNHKGVTKEQTLNFLTHWFLKLTIVSVKIYCFLYKWSQKKSVWARFSEFFFHLWH